MPVLADCADCGTAIELGGRPLNGTTTVCPDCGSTSYDSVLVEDDERDRIIDLASSTEGVGAETAAALAERMVTVDRLREATLSELRSVPGVGSKNSLALVEQVREGEVV